MEHRIKPGNKSSNRAFTLIELLIVLLLISLLASFVLPKVVGSINDAKESALKENLKVMRDALDDYYTDNSRYPASLDVLVEKRYLRKVPSDPVAEEGESWALEYSNDGENTGVINVHSSSTAISSQQTPYNEW